MKRKSKDKVINLPGRIMLQEIATRDWHILNGNFVSDEEGEYTYMGNGRTVIDYVIASTQAVERIEKLSVETRADTNHMPLTLKLENL